MKRLQDPGFASFALMLIFGVGLLVHGAARLSRPSVPASAIDGKPMTPNSVHTHHIRNLLGRLVILDNGTIVEVLFTGGTNPFADSTGPGVLTVTVPSNDPDDRDSTYYFFSFKPDHPADERRMVKP